MTDLSTEEGRLTDAERKRILRHMPVMTPGHVLADLLRDVEEIVAAKAQTCAVCGGSGRIFDTRGGSDPCANCSPRFRPGGESS